MSRRVFFVCSSNGRSCWGTMPPTAARKEVTDFGSGYDVPYGLPVPAGGSIVAIGKRRSAEHLC